MYAGTSFNYPGMYLYINFILVLTVVPCHSETSQISMYLGTQGQTISLHHNVTVTRDELVCWYQQFSHQAPEHLICTFRDENVEGSFQVYVDHKKGSSTLIVKTVVLSDAAVYYSAVRYGESER